ncbi:MAG: GNAT family N-acetyltransferase [Actinomycetia bacterium]|nr:GNAT family N-acetyltransferase [Actinomycetes bacterium]
MDRPATSRDIATGEVGLREFALEDADAVLAILLAAEDYMLAATGYFPEGGDLQSLFYALPDGASLDAKRLLVITSGEAVVGVCDALVGWPAPDVLTTGLFMVGPGQARRGIATRAAAIGLGLARDGGFRSVRASCPRDWEPGQAFLARLGFTRATLDRPTTTNYAVPPRTPAVDAWTLVLPPGEP